MTPNAVLQLYAENTFFVCFVYGKQFFVLFLLLLLLVVLEQGTDLGKCAHQ